MKSSPVLFFRSITLPGYAIYFIALSILIRSLFTRNVYEILLSSSALIFWIILGFRGVWAVRRFTGLEAQWQPPLPLAAAAGKNWLVASTALKLPLFFRLHFLLKGRFYPQGSGKETGTKETGSYKAIFQKTGTIGGCPVFAETALPQGSETAGFELGFPLGGFFRGEGSCRLRDIFGFFSFPCGVPSNQALNVRSAPCSIKPLRIDALSGAEDRRTKSSSNEERYYMREYTPGDRFRDINWKSSERIDTLITRITPDNQEKVTRIEICFRSYGPSQPSIGELWLLDKAKSRLAWFLRNAKEEKQGYVFSIHTPSGSRELKDQEEIDAFLEELASVPFSSIQSQSGENAGFHFEGNGELYVFSTACDLALPGFLLAQQGRPITLFISQNKAENNFKDKKESEEQAQEDPGYLRLSDFPAGGIIPLPRWLLPPKKHLLNVNCGRMMIDYAGIRL